MVSADGFSDRHGYRETDAEITVRDDAPPGLRSAILTIADQVGVSPSGMYRALQKILLISPTSNWADHFILSEVHDLINHCRWYHVYDIAKRCTIALADPTRTWRVNSKID